MHVTPIEKLRAAVKAAGGPSHVARLAKLRRSHLGNVLGGTTELGRETATRLRPFIDLDAETWVALLLPSAGWNRRREVA